MDLAAAVNNSSSGTTGFRLRLDYLNGRIPRISAYGIRVRGISVSPPTWIAAICPSASSVTVPLPDAGEQGRDGSGRYMKWFGSVSNNPKYKKSRLPQ
ncbi:hypothetical protein PN4B1_20590 [Paenibacillus naphthalenovorans]|uniref:hypothetical protein n=1 Tax=Paenibacillus naphthalenovorans TaxID=162209 RepID=UPI0010B1BA6F|nr:hypothetical protein [Paenibacillus naphthalenovorans]GCL72154.1 hypothetical protein PN4B1_20590 [Paenibacillus naphthalenovorans]